jgi:glycogen debranching enzyme
LVLQMDCLAKVAKILGRPGDAKKWKREADKLQQKMMKHFWRGDRFIAPRTGDHVVAEGDSLFNFMPLVLGQRLKPEQSEILLKGLVQPGRFLTEHGLATESVQSRFYSSDGYWRGPIWAPSTMLLVDAVDRLGRKDLAKDIALRYCKMAAKSGMPENYDAVTGAALRDKAYSWTSSVFLVLAKEYLT